MCAMLRRDQEAPLRPKPEVQVMTQEASKQYLPRERVVQDNLALMRRYFDLLYTKDLDALLELVDDDIEWLVVPTGDVIRGKASLAELAANHWGASRTGPSGCSTSSRPRTTPAWSTPAAAL
jgi:hypothetical protein